MIHYLTSYDSNGIILRYCFSITGRCFMPLTSGKSELHSFFLISDLRRNFGVHKIERVLL